MGPRGIVPTEVERQIEGVGVFLYARNRLARRRATRDRTRAMNNMADDPAPFVEAHGVISGSLLVRPGDRITIGETVVFLASGTKCNYVLGTVFRAVYTEHEGIKEAHHVARMEW